MIGRITGFGGSLGSGIAFVLFDDGCVALVESSYGLRQIAHAFGSLEGAVGKTIEYEVDALGLMESFAPVEAAA